MSATGTPEARRGTDARTRRIIALIAILAAAPVVLAWLAVHYWPRTERSNYGELLTAQTLPRITGTWLDGTARDEGAPAGPARSQGSITESARGQVSLAGEPFDSLTLRGKWIVLFAGSGTCDSACAQALYASRQARTIQNAARERVVRVWLVTDGTVPDPALLAQHPDLAVVRVTPAALAGLPRGQSVMYLTDPLGNLVLAWPEDPDIKAMAKDLSRLLRASQIG
jgi:hypothetical protein